MAQLLIRNGTRPFFTGSLQAAQDIEVENDETHWVGRDAFAQMCSNPGKLRQGFRVTIPLPGMAARTETVDNNETISIHANESEAVAFQNLLRPGAAFVSLEFARSMKRAPGLRAEGVKVVRTGVLADGRRWADMNAQGIIAILIGL
ncbi:MAG: hypothetical protein JNK48_25805 [Bryobacterales bacterium]|nr:hypothetical protein [Bryobacterales bacterium]